MFEAMIRMLLRAVGHGPPSGNVDLTAIVRKLQERQRELDATEIRLGLIGEAGVGKSSLINAIFGRALAPVDPGVPVMHSPDGDSYEHKGVKLIDLPGCGDPQHPFAKYIGDLKLLEKARYDGFLLVTATRLRENDVSLYKELHVKHKKPFFLVRNKFDEAGADEAGARSRVEADCRQHLQLEKGELIYFISTKHPERYDFPLLLESIAASVSELQRIRLLEAIPAYTAEMLKKKRQAVEELVVTQAFLAAANGLNPVPGLNIAIDLALLQNMTHRVIEAFGLTREQLERVAKASVGGIPLDKLLDIAAPVLARLAAGGLVKLLGVSFLAVKEGVEGGAILLPVVGPVVAAGLNFTTAVVYGTYLLNDCEESARKLLAALST